MEIIIQGKPYSVGRITYTELSQLAKYVNALSLDQNACLTPELDRASAHALRKLIPTIDPLIVNIETGISLDFLTEFYPLYKELEQEFIKGQNTVNVSAKEISAIESVEDEKIRIKQRLQELESVEGGK